MSTVQDADVESYLTTLMLLTLRVSPSQLVVVRQRGGRPDGGRHEVMPRPGGAPIARFTREADAALFARSLGDLRALTAAVVEVLAQHRDDGAGVCAQDGQPVPCTTRRILEGHLAPRAAAVEASTAATAAATASATTASAARASASPA